MQICRDSFLIAAEKDHIAGKQYPRPRISSSQLPLLYKGSIFYTGSSIGENDSVNDSCKYVVCESNKEGRYFYVNYPIDYWGNDWGGIYYRMVYNCNIGDSIMCLSFPASSTVALFNIKDKTVSYRTMFPDISQYIIPYKATGKNKFQKNKIQEHFYGQYSFRGIAFDKYRHLFYRFLLKPSEAVRQNKKVNGPKAFHLLIYDGNFNYLGYKEFNETYSYFTYFITEKGLFIQRLKNNKDEDNMFFDVFNLNDNYRK